MAPSSILAGLIGSGIATSLTPALHEHEGDAHGVRYVYRSIDLDRIGRTAPEAVSIVRAARELGYDALNVTHPCKQIVLDAMDELSTDAELLGAVNTVLFRGDRMIGLNTDQSGFASGFRAGLTAPKLDRVVLIGSGGAGSAIAYALSTMGVRRLSVFDVDSRRAESMQHRLGRVFADTALVSVSEPELGDEIAAADGLVNATPIGMTGHPGMPVAAEWLHPALWVADAIYRPLRTELIRKAEAMGCDVLDGGRMVVGQAVDAFGLITGLRADAERMRAHFLELTADEAPRAAGRRPRPTLSPRREVSR